MVQNFIYQNVSGFISYIYSDVYIFSNNQKNSSNITTLMLEVSLIDLVWDLIVSAFVDKRNPKW